MIKDCEHREEEFYRRLFWHHSLLLFLTHNKQGNCNNKAWREINGAEFMTVLFFSIKYSKAQTLKPNVN